MSTEMMMFDNLPEHIKTKDTALAESLGTVFSTNRISLKDGIYRFKVAGEEAKKLKIMQSFKAVILGVNPPDKALFQKAYYADSWDEESNNPPDCWSKTGIRPDESVVDPIHTTCASCPLNAFKSAKGDDGKAMKGKACQDRKGVIVALPGKHLSEGKLFELSVPPTSLRGLATYGKEVAAHGIDISKIITVFGVDEENIKQLTFSYGGYLDVEAAKCAAKRRDSAEVQGMLYPVATRVEESEPDDEAPPSGELEAAELFQDETEAAPPIDSAGIPHNLDFHTSNQAKKTDGTWKLKPGVNRKQLEAYESKYRTQEDDDDDDDDDAIESIDYAMDDDDGEEPFDLDALGDWDD